MSQKRRTPPPHVNPPAPTRRVTGRTGLVVATAAVLLLAFVVGAFLYTSEKARSAQEAAATSRAQLLSEHAPQLGDPAAKVHIVEFLDPACETCAAFHPHVKRLMSDHPGRIRLSIRHVAFHQGSEHVVRLLEAARSQGKYWQALEAVLASQDRWQANHRAYPERVWPELGAAGLDVERIRSEMASPEIVARMERDAADARAFGVTKTPGYFVNGRPLARFGLEELQALVREELRKAYP